MPVPPESSTMAEHMRLRGPRKPPPILTTDSRHQLSNIPPIIQSTTCKSTISSLLLSTFTNTHNPESNNSSGRASSSGGHANTDSKKKGFRNSGLRGFGCTAHPEVEIPAPAALIRSSADWKEKGERKSKKKKKKKPKERESVLEVQDVWCGPGIGFCSDDFVAPTRPVSSRGKIDVDEIHHRERQPYTARPRMNVDNFPDLEADSASENPRFGSDVFEARYYHHLRNRSPEGLSEILMFQNRIFMGARSYGFDRYRELRLDVENMSYEELLELGDKIGYVNTGLKEDEIGHCIRKAKISSLDDSSRLPTEADRKCSICQEEYETDDEMGRLECEHIYHIQCIKQWLGQKNACPICKAEASIP